MPYSANPGRPVLFVTVIFIALVGYSLLADSFPFPGTKRTNFISDVTNKKEKPLLLSARKPLPINVPSDSNQNGISLRDYLTYDGIISYEADRTFGLTKFITALKELKAGKRKKVRIAYFGDSVIEGDLISEDLRRMLQDAFGGNGVGFVPVTSVVSAFRETIVHNYSNNWTDNTQANSPQTVHFLSGHSFLSDNTSTVQYSGTSLPHLQSFGQVYALYGKANNPMELVVNGKSFSLPASALCNKTLVAENCNAVKIKSTNTAPLYGFSFEDSAGVFIDNYAFRGSTGMDLGNFNSSLLKQVQQVHDYDLIVFQYGPNLFSPKASNFAWYEKPMTAVVEKFKTAFSNASLLVISTADKCYRYEGEWETAVGVEPLMEAQNNFAAASGIDFWNLYRAMGGNGSMINWVEAEEPLARIDHTHFTYKGAKKIGEMLFTAIMKEYALAK